MLISTHGRPRCGRSQSALEGAGTAFYSTALLLYCFCFSVSMGSERGRSGRHCLQSCKLGHGMSLLCKRHPMLPKQRLHIGVERGQALQPHGMAHHFGLLARQPAAAWPCCSRLVRGLSLCCRCMLLSRGRAAHVSSSKASFLSCQQALPSSLFLSYGKDVHSMPANANKNNRQT